MAFARHSALSFPVIFILSLINTLFSQGIKEFLIKKYKKTFGFGSKFALGKESEDIDAFWEFHEQMSFNKVQKKIVDNFLKAVNDKKKDIINFVCSEDFKYIYEKKKDNARLS